MSAQDDARLTRRKLISLIGSTAVSLSAGSNYAFSSFAPQLQESLHLTSTQINLIGIAGNAGVYLSSPLWGRFIDKRGPKTALITAAILVPIGYAGLSHAYTSSSPAASVGYLFLLNLLTGLGNSGGFTAAMNAQAKSWGGSRRGSATALVLSGFGLSAFFYSSLSHALFPGKTGDYLYLLAFGSMTSMLIGLALIKIIPPTEHSIEHANRHGAGGARRHSAQLNRPPSYRRKRTSSDIGARTSIWDEPEALSAETSDQEGEDDLLASQSSRRASGPIRVRNENETARMDEEADPENEALLAGTNGSKPSPTNEASPHHIDISGKKLFKELDFALLFGLMGLVSGAGLLLINNVGTITQTLWDYNHRNQPTLLSDALSTFSLEALGDDLNQSSVSALQQSAKAAVQKLQAQQVSAISLCNASGRIIIGLLSDFIVNKTGNSAKRVWLLIVVTTLAFLSQLLAALPNTIETVHQLLAVSVLTGLAYGTLFGLCPVLMFEWFGMKHFSQNYGFLSLSPVLAGNIFNLMFGRIYDSHVPRDDSSHHLRSIARYAQDVFRTAASAPTPEAHEGKHHLCMEGEECYRQVFEITVVGCMVAVGFSIVLIARRSGGSGRLARYFGRT